MCSFHYTHWYGSFEHIFRWSGEKRRHVMWKMMNDELRSTRLMMSGDGFENWKVMDMFRILRRKLLKGVPKSSANSWDQWMNPHFCCQSSHRFCRFCCQCHDMNEHHVIELRKYPPGNIYHLVKTNIIFTTTVSNRGYVILPAVYTLCGSLWGKHLLNLNLALLGHTTPFTFK